MSTHSEATRSEGLRRWQATSHPMLSEQKPEELLGPEFAKRYRRLHKDLWHRMIQLHGTIETLETLHEFPFDLVYAPNGMEFWRLVAQNFMDAAIVLLHGLVNDQGKDANTLLGLRNELVRGSWRDHKLREHLTNELRQRRFSDEIQDIADRVTKIRNHRVAHRLVARETGERVGQMPGISRQAFRSLFDAAQSLFGAISLGSTYVTLAGDMIPASVGGKPTRSCLDSVLDAVLRDSCFVNLPERRGQWWPMDRERMPTEQVRLMNLLRNRVGLPEA